ncbi:MAG: branched-chain amino acid ABC transporter substrate-binding protein [Saezia sp.]
MNNSVKNYRPTTPKRRVFLSLPLLLSLGALGLPYTKSLAQSQRPVIKIAMIEGLSGALGNSGESVYNNLLWATERVNAAGGVLLNGRAHELSLIRFDSQGNIQNALSMLKAAIDQDIRIIVQGNSSAVASALIAAIDKHNARQPKQQVIFLNYSAIETSLTNEACSFWHFRFDAHADMRLQALFQMLKNDTHIRKVYLVGQDYSFGRYIMQRSRQMLAQIRPDIEIVGEILHPIGQVKDFIPYANNIKSSGAEAIITGNWGNDLSLLIRATRDIGLNTNFYTFYANDLGIPTAIGDAGIGRVLAVMEWHPNAGAHLNEKARIASDQFYQDFLHRFPDPMSCLLRLRMQIMIDMLARAITQAGAVDAFDIAQALEGMHYDNDFHRAYMRPEDHQLQQPLYVIRMEKAGTPDAYFPSEGSPYGFKTVLRLDPQDIEMPASCRMQNNIK